MTYQPDSFRSIVKTPSLEVSSSEGAQGFYVRMNVPPSAGCDNIAAVGLFLVPSHRTASLFLVPTSKALVSMGGIAGFSADIEKHLQPFPHMLRERYKLDSSHPFYNRATAGEIARVNHVPANDFDPQLLFKLQPQYRVPKSIITAASDFIAMTVRDNLRMHDARLREEFKVQAALLENSLDPRSGRQLLM